MPKPKTLNKPGKGKRKAKDQGPNTANEYLTTGVELEEAGEKWRGGDQIKSLRFFTRAIEMYETGLQKHPTSFDLAYNKARVQYEITQHPKLVTQLSAPLTDALTVALDSHRKALRLQQDNEDVLFNTAQVLTSLAEELSNERHADHTQAALRWLREAMELFQRCLVLQEYRYSESQEQVRLTATETGDANQDMDEAPATPGSSSEAEQWASIVEPVTKDALVDTAVAQLQTLATFCSLLTSDPGSGLAWVEEYWGSLQQKIDVYLERSTDRGLEVDLARANLIASLAETSFRTGRIDLDTYGNEVTNAYSHSTHLASSRDGLIAYAEIMISMNSAIAETFTPESEEALKKSNKSRWQLLSSTLDVLTSAKSVDQPVEANSEANARIFLLRGDAEIFRFRLGQQPWDYGPAQKSAEVLLKNAQTYYRGGAELAKRSEMVNEARVGKLKEAVTVGLLGDVSFLAAYVNGQEDKTELREDAEDIVEDGLVDQDDLMRLLSSVASS